MEGFESFECVKEKYTLPEAEDPTLGKSKRYNSVQWIQ